MKVKSFLYILFLVSIYLIFPLTTYAAIGFQISTIPDQPIITQDDVLPINITINNLTSCTTCYLQARITLSGKTQYFGYTQKDDGSWFKYMNDSSLSPSIIQSQFYPFQPVSGSWSHAMQVKLDTTDSNYKGSGQYVVDFLRYTGNSSSSAGSSDNKITFTVEDVQPTATLTPSPTLTPTRTPTPSNTPTPTRIPTPTKVPTPTRIPTPTKIPTPTHIPTPTKIPTPTPTIKLSLTFVNSPSDSLVSDESDVTVPESTLFPSLSASTAGVLGVGTTSVQPKVRLVSNRIKGKVLLADDSTHNSWGSFWLWGSVGIGIILLGSGILLIWRKRRIRE